MLGGGEIRRRVAFALVAAALMLWAAPAVADPAGPVQWRAGVDVTAAGASWTRLLKLQNGDWLAVYTVSPGSRASRLQIARSTDSGRTWTPISSAVDAGRVVDNGILFQLPNGDVLLAGRDLLVGQSYRIVVWRSTNNGVTWTASPSSVVDANENPGGRTDRGLWEPFLFLLPDGRLSILYADETVPGHSQVISQRVSSDGGATWGAKSSAVQSADSSKRPGMPGIARMSDGRYILVYEVCPEPSCQVHQKISSDGATWDNTTLGATVPGHACGPYITALGDGRLLVTSCTNEVSISDDLGATWKRIDPSPWGWGFKHTWPAIYQTGINEIAAVVSDPDHLGKQSIRFGTLSDFYDDCDDGNDAGWTRYSGSFGFSGGAYLLNNASGSGNASGKAVAGDPNWTNGYVEGDLTITSPDGNAGLMARVTNPGFGPDAASGYFAYLDRGGGVVGLGRQNGTWTSISRIPMTINTNQKYRLRLSTIGSTIQVYVDGALKITATDSTFTHGQIGVRSHYANATFDNVVWTDYSARDDFSDGNDVGWWHYNGAPSVSGGTYNLDNLNGTGKAAWNVPFTNKDFTFETDVRISAGGGDAGAIVRATSLGNGPDAMNGYWAGLNDGADAVVLGRMNGSYTALAAAPVSIATNSWHHLKVTTSGPSISVYVDDMSTPKINATDTTFPSGLVGVRANYTNASFDNTVVEAKP
jgi:hypothetical protein